MRTSKTHTWRQRKKLPLQHSLIGKITNNLFESHARRILKVDVAIFLLEIHMKNGNILFHNT